MTSLQTASLDEIREVAARLCRDYLTGRWKTVGIDELIVERINGGLSNFLYYISLPEDKTAAAVGAIVTEHEHEDDDVEGDNNDNNDDDDVDQQNSNRNQNDNRNACGSALLLADKNSNNAARAAGGGIACDLGTGTAAVAAATIANNKRHRTESAESSSSSASVAKRRASTEPCEVLLRVYGQTHGEDALEGMISESVVFALLSERNFGPKLHGIFPGGRIEQFIPARALATLELADHKISMKIAEKMGEIHSLNIPMSKEPDWVWNCMARWLKSTTSILSQTDWKDEVKSHLQLVRAFDFKAEVNWLKSLVAQGSYQVLFCHNDMQEGNILFRQANAEETPSLRDSVSSLRSNFEVSAIEGLASADANLNAAGELKNKRLKPSNGNGNGNDNSATPSCTELDNVAVAVADAADPDLIIIDFEYCAYNYRGFDLANHFLEWTFDYTNPEFPNFYHHKHQYSTLQQRHDFIVVYLKKLNGGDDYAPSAQEVHAVEEEVRVFSMFSHLFWSLWSLVNVTSNIQFGYWDYAVTRIREYKLLKQAFLTASGDSTLAA